MPWLTPQISYRIRIVAPVLPELLGAVGLRLPENVHLTWVTRRS